ncbi:MAG: hypothetical protein ACOY46_04000 [Bacillota bacterium]
MDNLRLETIKKIEEIKKSPSLTEKEKNEKILDLASKLGKKLLEDIIRQD